MIEIMDTYYTNMLPTAVNAEGHELPKRTHLKTEYSVLGLSPNWQVVNAGVDVGSRVYLGHYQIE